MAQFSVGDRVWILPDKQSSLVPLGCTKIEDLPDQYWDVGEIVKCCVLADPHENNQSHSARIGFLEVAVRTSPGVQ